MDEMWTLCKCYRLYRWFLSCGKTFIVNSSCISTIFDPTKASHCDFHFASKEETLSALYLLHLHGQWLVVLRTVVQQHLNGHCWLSLFKGIWFSGPWKCKAQLIFNKLILVSIALFGYFLFWYLSSAIPPPRLVFSSLFPWIYFDSFIECSSDLKLWHFPDPYEKWYSNCIIRI